MAAIPLGKSAIFNFSKALPKPFYAFSHGKVSRVCFTSATKHAEEKGRYNGDQDRRRDQKWGHNADKYAEAAADRTSEMTEEAKQRTKEGADKAKERTQDMKEKAEETAEKAKDRTSTMAEKAANKVQEAKDKAAETAHETKEKAHETKENTKGAAETVADKTKEYAHETKGAAETVAEKTKEGVSKVAEKTAETAQAIGNKTKQTMHKIKETVVGTSSDEESVDDYIEDHVRKPARENKDSPLRGPNEGAKMDEDVLELRRKAGESDNGDKKH